MPHPLPAPLTPPLTLHTLFPADALEHYTQTKAVYQSLEDNQPWWVGELAGGWGARADGP